MIPRTGIGSGWFHKYLSVPLPDPDKQGKGNSGHAENRKKFISMASSRGSSFDFNPDSGSIHLRAAIRRTAVFLKNLTLQSIVG